MIQEPVGAQQTSKSQDAASLPAHTAVQPLLHHPAWAFCSSIFSTVNILSRTCGCCTEIHFNGKTTATGIREALLIDPGYLSRILRKFEKQGLVIKHPLPEDGRSAYLTLTASGQQMQTMNELSDNQIRRYAGEPLRRKNA